MQLAQALSSCLHVLLPGSRMWFLELVILQPWNNKVFHTVIIHFISSGLSVAEIIDIWVVYKSGIFESL